ncbi:cold shock domain-containing protein [Cardiobacterium valvarum]|nr:cold shock domain-containing protein [Cardiobacterium valvarum]
MQGEIKTYLPEKHYGFIKGDDSKDYFFHEKDFIAGTNLSDLAEGLRIKFEQQATPRGYRARKCQVLQGMEGMRYAVPEDFIVTRKNPSQWLGDTTQGQVVSDGIILRFSRSGKKRAG